MTMANDNQFCIDCNNYDGSNFFKGKIIAKCLNLKATTVNKITGDVEVPSCYDIRGTEKCDFSNSELLSKFWDAKMNVIYDQLNPLEITETKETKETKNKYPKINILTGIISFIIIVMLSIIIQATTNNIFINTITTMILLSILLFVWSKIFAENQKLHKEDTTLPYEQKWRESLRKEHIERLAYYRKRLDLQEEIISK